jgi:imidazolonepropionase-like amidohydrolase
MSTTSTRLLNSALIPTLALLAATACGGGGATQDDNAPVITSTARLYEGARLIAGNDGEPIEDAAFLVDDGVIVAVGRSGELGLPLGAGRVDLADKTVMPMLVGLHGHPGYQQGVSYEADNYSRATLTDHLDRYAYYGVGTVLSLGTDAGSLAFEIRGEQQRGLLGGARLLTAGRGLAPPNAGPGAAALRGSAYGVTTEDEAREAVRELSALDVDAVKIWVDDRNGSVEKLDSELYRAIIEEAHSRGLTVIAHVYTAADAADLVDAGVDGFAHLVRDEEMSSALVAAIESRDVFIMPNLGVSERAIHAEAPSWLDDPLLHETVLLNVVTRAKESFGEREAESVARARESYANMERSLMKLTNAGVPIVLGADSGVQDHFFGYSEIRELELMVAAGMTPAEVIEAATSRPADILGLDAVGSLTPGKSADFIVLNASPLDDIANLHEINDVYMRGERLNRETLRASFIGR